MDSTVDEIVTRKRLAFVAILVGGVVGFGLADYVLVRAGYPMAGAIVWAVGYAGTVLLLWYGWIRPLEFRGS